MNRRKMKNARNVFSISTLFAQRFLMSHHYMNHHHALFAACLLALSLSTSVLYGQVARDKADVYTEFNYGQDRGGDNWVQAIMVSEPAYRAEVKGDVTVKFKAPGMTAAKAMC